MTYGGDPQFSAGVCEGEVLAGKYRVERVLGVGGMGVVVAAYNTVLDTRVALKFLLPTMLSNTEAVARFLREARAAARIVSEHAARVYDVGTLDSGSPYIVMELLEGGDLAEWLRQRGPLAIEQAVDFVLQACVAVAEAHGMGIVHRDLKPANLFCIRGIDGQLVIKVLDFGISKLTEAARVSDAPGLSVTKTATVMGSPLYMSPEQMRSAKDVDAQTDLWALGVVLFQLLTGVTPFVGEAVAEVAAKVASDPAPSPRSLRSEISVDLEAVILRCLQKDRRERYANVGELALALLPFGSKRARFSVEKIAGIVEAAGQSAGAVPPSEQRPRREGPSAASVSPWSGTRSGTGGKRKKLLRALALAVPVAALGAFFVLRSVRDSSLSRAARESSALAAARPAAELAAGTLPAERCVPGAVQCSGASPRICDGDRWHDGPVTAGRCGAECTPGSSPPRCSGLTPESCDSSGRWTKDSACPYACREGACAGTCVPGAAQCSGSAGVETCDADGEWAKPVACAVSSVCRDGACVQVARRPSPNCDPNYVVDPQSGAHIFKPECFSDSRGRSAAP